MAWRTNRVTVLNVIDIPDGIPEGAVIGLGGYRSKLISSKHGVRCKVPRGSRTVHVEGLRDGVESATRDIHELFDQERVERERMHMRRQETPGLPWTSKTIHMIAVAKHSEHSAWCFNHRDDESIGEDPNVKDFVYRLVAIPASHSMNDHDDADRTRTPLRWVTPFDPSFRQRMLEQVSSISTEDPASIKLKAAFGLQCFSLPDDTVTEGKVYSWEELQALELYSHVKPRWSNMLNLKSAVLTKLLNDLEEQFGQVTTFKTELVVYVNKRQGSRGDISIKFRWEYGEWVLIERKPMRVAHALYNIALDNETAFRVRVYSRHEAPPSLVYTDIVDGLKTTVESDRDPFSTTVTTQHGFPHWLFLRSFAVRETAIVEAHGLRFTISYMDAKRKTATIACRLTECDTVIPSEAIELLIGKVLATVAQS